MRDIKKSIILGFGLFAMFFGAGNTLLPSYIGIRVGGAFPLSVLGFVLTGVGLPLLGLLVVIRNEGDYHKIFEPMGEVFFKIYLFISFLLIGPIIAMPRLAATSYEMGVLPVFPNANKLIITFVFFAICLLCSINKSKVVEIIGRYLTPLLIIMLVILIIVGIVSPKADTRSVEVSMPFIYSFLEGYNTLDAVASIVFAKLIYDTVKNEKNRMGISVKASIVAAICLTVVYAGLVYLGNRIPVADGLNLSRSELIMNITNKLLGKLGIYALIIIIILACVTTAIGLISSVSNFFNELSKNKLGYNRIAIIITFVSFLIAQLGVDDIINLSVPVLCVFYPVLIIILILNVFKGKIITNKIIRISTYLVLILAIIYQLKNFI
ncbi:branched-chain amino acid transport system II carrier protein [uncultured Sneathia sp.]|uniref:branched-chain amino acid transport system II carrier protein n=1 Tax=uncultured Sneathia sp. TaxID=278067 RepID=UPI002599C5E9|nr:branched-chain amino acid transport system II carrier protein [uncultured Sneathia sp.]